MKLWESNGLDQRDAPPAMSVLRRSVWVQTATSPLLAVAQMGKRIEDAYGKYGCAVYAVRRFSAEHCPPYSTRGIDPRPLLRSHNQAVGIEQKTPLRCQR